ncbi:hypothetical protein NESM_000523100 [Novymonas esmeraldas]|uniref:Uncharacterized protein n=1 Tax=Novymonas esmeraldas TaxID=1808958 RepID=A0AAW0ERB0_9TRYP
MSLPSELQLGPHVLRLLPVSRDATVAPGARRCSDSLLTSFCFVGELLPPGTADVGGTAGVVWYYSPLFHFERKRIRVEESVIEAALSTAVSARRHADVNSPLLDCGCVVESVPSEVSSAAPEAEAAASVSVLPAVFLRLGMSTTFREYRLVAVDAQEAPDAALVLSAEPCAERDAMTVAGADNGEAPVAVHRPPLLHVLTAKRPTLTPIDTRLRGSGLLSRLRLTHMLGAQLRRSGDPASGATAQENLHIEDGVATPVLPSPAAAGPSSATYTAPTPLRPPDDDRGDAPPEAALLMPVSLAVKDTPTTPRSLRDAAASAWAASTKPCVAPEDDAAKDATHSHHLHHASHGGAASSVSSAFLSSSLFFSCVASQAATSVLSASRSMAAEIDGRPSSSTGASGSSGRFLDDPHVQSRETTCLLSAACTPLSRSTSLPAPPTGPKSRPARRPRLRPRGSAPAGWSQSAHVPHAASTPSIQLELTQEESATLPPW